jgi:tetrahydromethanopterin S-methyltransferase subunit E
MILRYRMEISYPGLTTAALFMALIILDFAKQQYKLLIGHFLVGIIAVLLMVYLSQNGADLVAWGVFSIPLVMLGIGLSIGALRAAPGTVSATATAAITARARVPDPVPCDASGNPLPAVTAAATSVTPAATVACGPGTGQTQCIDTSKLASA